LTGKHKKSEKVFSEKYQDYLLKSLLFQLVQKRVENCFNNFQGTLEIRFRLLPKENHFKIMAQGFLLSQQKRQLFLNEN